MTNKPNIQTNDEYRDWLLSLKNRIQSSQQKAAISVNKELIHLYFYLGGQLYEKKQNAKWGDKIIEQVSEDLKKEFSEIKGFSVRNLKYCNQFYEFYHNSIGQQPVAQLAKNSQSVDNVELTIKQQLVAQIPWGHNILIFTKSETIE